MLPLGGVDFLPPVQLTVMPWEMRSVVWETVTARFGKGAFAASGSCCAAVTVTAVVSAALALPPCDPAAANAAVAAIPTRAPNARARARVPRRAC